VSKSPIAKRRTKKHLEELKKKIPEECMEKFCNEGCVNTIFEDGKTKMPHVRKDRKFLEKLLKQQKKDIFGNKDTVLKDHFYEKLSKQTQSKMKSLGAISGCVLIAPDENIRILFKSTTKKKVL